MPRGTVTTSGNGTGQRSNCRRERVEHAIFGGGKYAVHIMALQCIMFRNMKPTEPVGFFLIESVEFYYLKGFIKEF